MKAAITSISRRNLAAGEAFTVTVKLTLGKSESAVNGNVELCQFTMNNWNGEYVSNGAIIGTLSGVKIAKGASKTLTFNVNAMERKSLIANSPDHGEARGYKYGFEIDADNADGYHYTYANNVGTILTDRLAPVIDSATLTDPAGGLDHFDVLVQNMSAIDFTGAVTLDPLDTSLTATHTFKMEYEGGEVQEYTSTDGVFTGLTLPYTGALSWRYTVTDSVGNSANTGGNLEVAPYTPPTITELSAERYKEQVADDGTTSYVAADDGEHVRFSLRATACKIKEKNAWTLTVAWNDQSKTVMEDSGRYAACVIVKDRFAVTDVISAAERVEFTWTLTDFFTSAVMCVTVDKAGAYFSVEKNGVAVGMRATGTDKDKKFEVAQDYKSHFYGGAFGADGRRLDRVAKTEILELASGWVAYNESYTPRVSRVGALVFLDGLAKNTAAKDSGFSATIATLPEWARPVTDAHAIQQGSGRAIWWERVYANGALTIARYRNETGYVSAAANSQFPLTMCWIAADAFDETT